MEVRPATVPDESHDQGLNEAIAREVFGVSQAQIDAWPWWVPAFCQDRNEAAAVACRIGAFDSHRETFNRTLARLVPRLHGGLAESIVVCTPKEICQAALATLLECGPLKRSAVADMDHHIALGEATLDALSPANT